MGEFTFANKQYKLKITKVYTQVTNGRFQVDMQFVGPVPKGIRRGQTLQILLALSDERQAVLVPRGGFYQQTGGNWIFKVSADGKTAYRADIQLGNQNQDYYEVLQGLKPGDKVIFQFELNQDFIPVFWGCMLGGLVPVPIAVAPTYHQVNGAVSKLHNAWLMLDCPIVLTSLRLAPAIRSVSRLFKSEEFRVVVVEELRTAAPDSRSPRISRGSATPSPSSTTTSW
jgi:hypothetical protein